MIDATRELVRAGMRPLVPFHPYFAHPPLFPLALAGAWRLFGDGRAVGHWLVFPFLPLLMSGPYALGRRLDDRLLGLAAAFLVGTSALVVTEVGQVYFELPMVALVTCGLAGWLWDRRALGSALFCVAALTKIPAAAVPCALVAMTLARRETRRDLRAYAALLAPALAVLGWGAYHAHVTGWFLVTPVADEKYGAHSAVDLVRNAVTYFPLFFVRAGRWLVLVAGAGGFAYARFVRPAPLGEPARTLAVVTLLVFAFFTLRSEFLTRYALLALPTFVTVSLFLLKRAIGRATPFGAIAGALVIVFATTWHPARAASRAPAQKPPEDLSYRDVIAVLREAAAFVDEAYPTAEIEGGFHEGYVFGEPHQGYATVAHTVVKCPYFARRSDVTQIVVLHPYGLEQRICARVLAENPAYLVRRFEKNGQWIELFRIDP